MKTVEKTIGRVVEEVSQKFPERHALVHTEAGVRYTYGLLWWEVERIAKGLLKLGVRRGDTVALWAPNIPEWITAMLALSRMGAVMVPVDPGAAAEDLGYILEDSECTAVIMTGGPEGGEYIETLAAVREQIPSLEHAVLIAEGSVPGTLLWSELAAMGDEADSSDLEQAERNVKPGDPVAVMYTSGTTGKPKGVVLDHLGLVNKSVCATARQGLTHEDRLCVFFPLFHMFGNTCIALSGLFTGAALVMPCRSFDPPQVLRAIDKEQCTAIYGSPSMLIALIDHPEFRKKRWRSLVKGVIGGAPCPMSLMRKLVEEVGVTDVTVAYGITEASSWLTMTRPDDPIELRVSTIGTALECNEVKIVDPATGETLPANTQGELCTRGFLMKGYHKMQAATAAAVDREGWFHTGDLGEMDEQGYVRITGRLKDVIVRDGVEIYPKELEETLYQLPGISEVQVFGFPEPEKGHEVAVWVRVREDSVLSAEKIADYLNQTHEAQVSPRYVKLVSSFPMTRSGKVQKFKMAEMAEKEYVGR